MALFLIRFAVLCGLLTVAADPMAKPKDAKEALAPMQGWVGSWKATGTIDGTVEEKQAGLWSEMHQWEWNFAIPTQPKLKWTVKDGKHAQGGEVRFRPEPGDFVLVLDSLDGKKLEYVGTLTVGKQKEVVLAVERKLNEEQIERLTFTQLHSNRTLVRCDIRPIAGKQYTKKYQIGATKDGEAFAKVGKGNECIVSGGRGTIPLTHKGVTYYVCCSGCKDAFLEDPEKWINAAKKP